MICIFGERANGKSRALLKMSSESGIPIAVSDANMADFLKHHATSLGIEIPDPVVSGRRNQSLQPVMVDEAQRILERHFGRQVVIATFDFDCWAPMTPDDTGFRLRDLLRLWWHSAKRRI